MSDYLLNVKHDFSLVEATYLLNHSVGRPLKSLQQAFIDSYFAPWQDSGREPWGQWLTVIDQFTSALARLFNGDKADFCPQVNLSSALTKLIMSLERMQGEHCVVLMSEIDFPSMGFVLKKALPASCELRFIPKALDITDANVWDAHLTADVDLVFISHAYSNTGQQAPLDAIVPLAKARGCLTLIDVAQSAGIIPLDLSQLAPDFMIGSSVKWLCSGPGAAYLWLHPQRQAECRPKDVGWFSHENPFEFDIHDFRYHHTALRFWGGTPSIAPYALAAHSISYFAKIGSLAMRRHNQSLMDKVADALAEELVSPRDSAKRSGTLVLQFGAKQDAMLAALQQAQISVDVRSAGIRISPHIYNDEVDMQHLLATIAANR